MALDEDVGKHAGRRAGASLGREQRRYQRGAPSRIELHNEAGALRAHPAGDVELRGPVEAIGRVDVDAEWLRRHSF